MCILNLSAVFSSKHNKSVKEKFLDASKIMGGYKTARTTIAYKAYLQMGKAKINRYLTPSCTYFASSVLDGKPLSNLLPVGPNSPIVLTK